MMLTHHDRTVANATEVFEQCKNTRARYWGMKEIGLPVEQMETLYAAMRAAGKITCLEVVDYTEEGGLDGARLGARCGCDILMGTLFYESIAEYCHSHGMRYMPFVGTITGRPSVLTGDVDEIAAEACRCLECGADGVDLLGYRYVGDAVSLNSTVVARTPGPVCLAGSVDSFERIEEVCRSGAGYFTIGSAFFDGRFGSPSFAGQIEAVIDHIAAVQLR